MTQQESANATALRRKAEGLGLQLDETQVEAFNKYFLLLSSANTRTNLTAIPESKYVDDHFIDSLTLLQTGRIGPSDRILDIGSGAGLPGLAVKLALPDAHVFLLEANGKKASFLRETVSSLGLSHTEVVNERAEKAGRFPQLRESMDVVTARAVASLAVLLEYASPFLRVGGFFLAMKGPEVGSELTGAAAAARLVGCEIVETCHPKGLEGSSQRAIVIFRKCVAVEERFPRRDGVPSKNPLA